MQHRLQRYFRGDPVIWGCMFILAVASVLVVYSAVSSLAYRKTHGNTEYFLIKHFSLTFTGLLVMWFAHRLDYRYYAAFSRLALWVSLPLLLFTWRHGATLNEAARWLMIPVINKTFQPSDLAQFALITQLAIQLTRQQGQLHDFRRVFLPLIGWSGAVCGLIALTNLSAALLLFGTCLLMLFMAQARIKHLMALVGAGLVVVGLAVSFGQRGRTAQGRLSRFLKGEVAFQTEQSYIAIASGGFYGKGPGKSYQRNFLPHPYSDFIYAIILEEYGMVGGIFVLLLYLLLLYRSIRLCSHSSLFGSLLAAGLGFSLTLQALTNMAVAVGLFPVTGLPLPFLSMGGTSLLFTGLSVGAILSVSRGELPQHNAFFSRQPQGNTYRAGE